MMWCLVVLMPPNFVSLQIDGQVWAETMRASHKTSATWLEVYIDPYNPDFSVEFNIVEETVWHFGQIHGFTVFTCQEHALEWSSCDVLSDLKTQRRSEKLITLPGSWTSCKRSKILPGSKLFTVFSLSHLQMPMLNSPGNTGKKWTKPTYQHF